MKPEAHPIALAWVGSSHIIYGTIITEGLQDVIEQVFDEVHISNMSKLGDDGKPVRREDGKVIKGENYKAPDLKWLKIIK